MNILAGIGKWIVTSIIIPACVAWMKAQNAIRKYNKKADESIKKAEAYEAGTNTDRDSLP